MRIATKEFKVYKFEELSEVSKEVVRNMYTDFQEPDDFCNMCQEYLKDTVGITELEIGFSLSYSQGDGVCMYGEFTTYNDKFFEIITEGLTDEQKELYKKYFYKFMFIKTNHHYSHSRTVSIDVEKENIQEEDENRESEIDTIFDTVLENIEKWYFKECKDFEESGYKFFYEISDEDLKEYCEANEYEFTENGKLFS